MDDPVAILEQVRDCLDNWSIAVRDISVASQSENIVYQVKTQTGSGYALRIHRPGYHTLQELVSEHEWTEALIEAGFRLPAALATTNGAHYVAVQVDGGTRYAGLIEWLEGQSLEALTQEQFSTDFLCATLEQLGQLMAALHEHSRRWQHSDDFTRHRFDIDGFFGASPFWGRYWESPFVTAEQQQLLLASQKNLVKTLRKIGTAQNAFGMIHGDLHHGNVLLGNHGMYVIDFDDAGFGWYLYDIAVALHEYQSITDFEKLSAALLRGYETVTPLTDQQRSLIPVFIHIRSLAIIGWATARPELDNAERLRQLVDHTCKEAFLYL